MLLVAGIVATTALAGTAIAQAETAGWTMGGEPITEDAQVKLTGDVTVKTNGSTMTCTEHTWDRTTWYHIFRGYGHLNYEITRSTCVRTGVLSSACTELVSITPEYSAEAELENTFHVQGENNGGARTEKVENVKFVTKLKGGAFCPKEIVAKGDLVLTPNNTEAMTAMISSGTLETNIGKAEVSGVVEVTEGSGTFGIE
ncbi:MAG TPA: hypothetical protein VHA54_00345 [Solirubrobacterales bacterium]|nr:hypothetical protein [Solirubrobacterales bacterium]